MEVMTPKHLDETVLPLKAMQVDILFAEIYLKVHLLCVSSKFRCQVSEGDTLVSNTKGSDQLITRWVLLRKNILL